MPKKYRPISLKNINTCRLKTRKSKVGLDKAGKPFHEWSFRSFLDSLPDILAARDFKSVIKAIVSARKKDRPVILGMGAHPIKVGLSPIIVNMIENHIISAVAMNGACIVHDYELALMGHTSEDVDIELCKGTFGMSEETGVGLNRAIKSGVKKGLGVGRAVGDQIMKLKTEFKDLSILAAAARLDIPATVHVAIGTDIIHMHPDADGKAMGEGSLRDFKLLSSVVSDLKGGVYINLGSAVIMPEVFLKAIAVTRNLKYTVKNFTTVNMDSYALTGHHEIMFPMLAAAVTEELVKS
jgi:deoxyhypusine synthase